MRREKSWGYAGHLCVGNDCLFHLCTTVGKYMISTVGDYRPYKDKPMETIGVGAKSFFETYVFEYGGKIRKCGCCPEPKSFSEIDGRRWETAIEANAGHEKYVRKYRNKRKKK